MVARRQHTGHAPTLELLRSGVVRVIEYAEIPLAERILHRRIFVPQHARQQPHDRIRHHERRQSPVREDVVADGPLVIDQVIRHPLIDPFVVPAEQNEMLHFPGGRPRHRLIEDAALRRHEHDPRVRRPQIRERSVDRLDPHDHPGATAVGHAVGDPVAARRPLTEIHRFEVRQSTVGGPLQHALPQRAPADPRKKCQYLNLHDVRLFFMRTIP